MLPDTFRIRLAILELLHCESSATDSQTMIFVEMVSSMINRTAGNLKPYHSDFNFLETKL